MSPADAERVGPAGHPMAGEPPGATMAPAAGSSAAARTHHLPLATRIRVARRMGVPAAGSPPRLGRGGFRSDLPRASQDSLRDRVARAGRRPRRDLDDVGAFGMGGLKGVETARRLAICGATCSCGVPRSILGLSAALPARVPTPLGITPPLARRLEGQYVTVDRRGRSLDQRDARIRPRTPPSRRSSAPLRMPRPVLWPQMRLCPLACPQAAGAQGSRGVSVAPGSGASSSRRRASSRQAGSKPRRMVSSGSTTIVATIGPPAHAAASGTTPAHRSSHDHHTNMA